MRWAIHVSAPSAVVADVAARVDAPWTLDVREKLVGSRMEGAQVFCRDREGRVIETLEADDVVGALLHLRAAVRLDCHIQRRPATANVYERGARLWYASAEVRDEIRRREDLARKPGRWLYELTPREGWSRGFAGDELDRPHSATRR